jgi:hypothetical protein
MLDILAMLDESGEFLGLPLPTMGINNDERDRQVQTGLRVV